MKLLRTDFELFITNHYHPTSQVEITKILINNFLRKDLGEKPKKFNN